MATIEEILLTDIEHDQDFVREDGTGDLQTISGLENVRQALLRRLMTVPGSLAHRPEYGVGIKLFQNKPFTLEFQRQIANRISEQFVRDTRVEKVSQVAILPDSNNPSMVKIIVSVKIKGYGDAEFNFVPFGE